MNNKEITLFAKTINAQIVTLQCRSKDYILTVKMLIRKKKEEYVAQNLTLIFAGKELCDHSTLEQYNIEDQSTLQLTQSL